MNNNKNILQFFLNKNKSLKAPLSKEELNKILEQFMNPDYFSPTIYKEAVIKYSHKISFMNIVNSKLYYVTLTQEVLTYKLNSYNNWRMGVSNYNLKYDEI